MAASKKPVETDSTYSEEETQRRVEAALKASFKMPRKTDAEMKVGKQRGAKSAASLQTKAKP